MKVLLMGGSGIISSEICDLSLAKGYDVSIMNRGKRKDKINPNAKLITCDLKNETIDIIKKKMDPTGYDVIFDFVTYNTKQLKRSLKIASGLCKQFIFVSSATAYITKEKEEPFIETDRVGDTGWEYAAEKVLCEEYLKNHINEYTFFYTIIRPYITYGETRIPYQVIPLKYYTLINRILNDKPIPLFGENIRCTLTLSSDFAVGAIGLFLNQKAINQIFHITGDCVTTWEKVIKIIESSLGKKANIIYLDKLMLQRGQKVLGIDTSEILFDKGRNMVFCNKKIKDAVPDFRGETSIEDGLIKSLDYFTSNKDKQVIDYVWDARIDSLLHHSGAVIDKNSIVIKSYKYNLTTKEEREYLNNRSDYKYWCGKIMKKLLKRS